MQDTLEIEDYYTEVQVSEESKLVGLSLKQLVDSESYEIDLVGVVRNGNYLNALNLNVTIQSEDVLMIKADSKHLQSFVDVSGTKILVESDTHTKPVINKDNTLIEVVVMKESPLVGKSVAQMRLLEDYGIDLLAKTGGRKAKTKRLSYQVIKMGDVLLIQGNANRIAGEITNLGCLALTEREQKIGDERKISVYLMIVIAGIASVILRLLPVHIAFPLSALLLVLSGVIPYREVYKAVDWSVIVMLGAMIPFGRAMIISGGADTISNALLYLGQYSAQWLLVGLLLLLTMLLTNLVNNATTSIVMAPIAIELARSLGTSPDLYLMTVAVGACSVFLSPIGHQANTLVMGPGGYRFGDYWRVGLGLQIIVLVSAIPLLLYYWG